MRFYRFLAFMLGPATLAFPGARNLAQSTPRRPADSDWARRIRHNHRVVRAAHAHRSASAPLTPRPELPILSPPPSPSQESFDVLHYALDLDIDPWDADRVVAGTIEVVFEPVGPTVYEIELDLAANMNVDGVDRNGAGTQPFDHVGDQLAIALDPPLHAGQIATIAVDYHGTPIPDGFGGFGIYWDRNPPVVWTLSEPEEARAWWPCKDRPDDKATADISVTMDTLFTVGSNGLLQSVVDNENGTATHNWSIGYPIPPYLVAITATDFVLIEDSYELLSGGTLPLAYYTWPETVTEATEDVSAIPGMLAIFETEWGDYPYAEEKYGQIEFPWGGAMEHATLTSYGSGLYTGTHYYDWIAAHELAHQWWGDLVTCGTWDDIWLNEGFATWGEAIWIEGLLGEAAYLDYMQATARPSFSGPIYAPNYTFNSTVYDKGAWVLHMLRGIVGRERTIEILRTWGETYAHASAVTSQFTELAAAVVGEDLDWFFDPWLYEAGRPRYDYAIDLTALPGDSTRVELVITQTQTGFNPYRMPITLRLDRAGAPDIFTTIVDSSSVQQFLFDVSGTVTDVEPDPDGYVLAGFRKIVSAVERRPQLSDATSRDPRTHQTAANALLARSIFR
ncbi:MAG: hypothetical protein CME06_07925 [Gemmatimonadetes bacterium]|nr:hypothetical protein [Gemmatimonadota bacterium]